MITPKYRRDSTCFRRSGHVLNNRSPKNFGSLGRRVMMGLLKWLKAVAVTGGLVLAPVVSMGAVVQSCAGSGPATPESYTGNLSREGSRLLNDMRYDARQVASRADTLQALAMDPEVNWQAHADELARIKHEVDDMGKRLCRL